MRPLEKPTAATITAIRERYGLTRTQAGRLAGVPYRQWLRYEIGQRGIHPATWSLFLIRAGSKANLERVKLPHRHGQPVKPKAPKAKRIRVHPSVPDVIRKTVNKPRPIVRAFFPTESGNPE